MSLYVAELGIASILVGLYRAPTLVPSVVTTKPGLLLAFGVALLGIAGRVLAVRWRSASRSQRRAMGLALATNVMTVIVLGLAVEGLFRGIADTKSRGTFVGDVQLRPTWEELVAQSRSTLREANPSGGWDESYFVYDGELGWTVGPGRRSRDGLYHSSVEGTRAATTTVSIADSPRPFRVALVGDSYAFSLEVPFGESWGHQLQELLDEDTEVLNFGVDGYGFDQMWLRYERDVRPWNPDIVLIGFTDHDLQRAMAVYPFVSFGWPGYLVKPRFAVEDGRLMRLNPDLPDPDSILGAGQIQALPIVDHDIGFSTGDWRVRSGGGLFLVRYLTSAYPRWVEPRPGFSADVVAELNGALLSELVRAVERDRSVPLVVRMTDVGVEPPRAVRRTIESSGVTLLPIDACLSEVPEDRRIVPGGRHFSGPANLAVARCTAPAVLAAVRGMRESRPRP